MKTRLIIKRILTYVLGLVCTAYLCMAFTMFNKPDPTKHVCEGVGIDIADEQANGFITKAEIEERLKSSHLYPVGTQMSDIDIRAIEEMLAQSPFVETAECYKSVDDNVNIRITQRLPIIRVKASNGDDYYVDDKDSIMPNMQYTSDLIIATGHISRRFATEYVAPLGKALMANELWRNLVEQVNVLPDNGIEIVPRVGSHVVYLGQLPPAADKESRQKAVDSFVDQKLARLMKFYRYGLPQAGWNKYSYINLEFDNQIVCKRMKVGKESTPQEASPETPVQPDLQQSAEHPESQGTPETPRQQ